MADAKQNAQLIINPDGSYTVSFYCARDDGTMDWTKPFTHIPARSYESAQAVIDAFSGKTPRWLLEGHEVKPKAYSSEAYSSVTRTYINTFSTFEAAKEAASTLPGGTPWFIYDTRTCVCAAAGIIPSKGA